METQAVTGNAFAQIPEISLSTCSPRDVVRALHEVGFFILVDHGVDQRLIDDYFAALKDFFFLPQESKALMAKSASRHFRGWEGIGSELTNNRVDYREQIDLSTEHHARQPDVMPAYLRLDGPNQWLPEEVLPGFRSIVMDYFSALAALADRLMGIIAVGLGMHEDTFVRRFGEAPLSFMKLISYPPSPPGEAGVNGHHDAGFLTLLMQHGVGGLQVENPHRMWVDVPPRDDAFVVNIGEMLQSMTGNYLVATNHRVISASQRYSSAYFHGPDLRASLEPLDLGEEFTSAVELSSRHRDAGFMASRDQLLSGQEGLAGAPVPVFGEQMWNYYTRSYPDLVRKHYPDVATAIDSGR